MKIKELRSLLANYEPGDLRLIIAELYKCIPKKLREERGIDEILTNPHGARVRRGRRGKSQVADLDDLGDQIEQFLDDAYNQRYFAPNRFVSKRDRPKWRFMVKRFVRDLTGPRGEETGFRCHMALREPQEAVSYFYRHHRDQEEIALYVLLSLLAELDRHDQWLEIYDEAVRRGVKPRDRLKETARSLRQGKGFAHSY